VEESITMDWQWRFSEKFEMQDPDESGELSQDEMLQSRPDGALRRETPQPRPAMARDEHGG
jgi:hypothetical protein